MGLDYNKIICHCFGCSHFNLFIKFIEVTESIEYINYFFGHYLIDPMTKFAI